MHRTSYLFSSITTAYRLIDIYRQLTDYYEIRASIGKYSTNCIESLN